MTLELNLVFSDGIYSTVFTLLSRSRVKVESDDDTTAAILNFLNNNAEVLRDVLSDETIVDRIASTDFITINDFQSLKYLLANQGVDVLVYEVADMEVNPEEIPEGEMEYVIIDKLRITSGVHLASKFVVSTTNVSLEEVYSKAIEVGNYFGSALTQGYKNPLKNTLETLKQTEQILGQSPIDLTSAIQAMLDYLGTDIVAIKNK